MKMMFDSKAEMERFVAMMCRELCPSEMGLKDRLKDIDSGKCWLDLPNVVSQLSREMICGECWTKALEPVSEVREPVEVRIDAEGMYMPDEQPKMPDYNELEEKRKRMNKSIWQGR